MVYPPIFLRPCILVGILLFILTACSQSPQANKTQNQAELRLSIASDPIHLDVARASDSVSGFILRMIYDGLTRLDKNSNPLPALAERWTITQEGTCYRFYLRAANWSNGQPIRAQDFVKAWQYILDPKTASPNAYLLFPILHARLIKFGQLSPSALGVKAIDDRTLEVKLERATPYFLQLLAFDAFYPSLVPSLGEKALEGPVSSGPFQLESWKVKNEIRLKANPHYWDKENVKLSSVRILVIADAQTALHMYERKELDWMGSPLTPLPADANEALAAEGSLQIYHGSSTYWIHCYLENKLLNHPKARQALSLALDRKRLSVNLGMQHEPASRLVPELMTGYYASFPLLCFDPAMARKLWQEALDECGLEKTPPLVYIYNGSGLHAKVAQLLQSEWKQHLGIDISLEGLEWAIFLQRVRSGNFDLARFGWRAQFSDPTTFLDIFEDPEGAYNFSRFNNEPFRNEMNQARLSQPKQRMDHLVEAEKILLQELPVLPLFFESYTYLKNPGLKGVILGPLGRIDFKFAYWENPHS